jgi:hypothetical protein
MHRRHWLDYDPVVLVVLVIGIGMIELLALSIDRLSILSIETKIVVPRISCAGGIHACNRDRHKPVSNGVALH